MKQLLSKLYRFRTFALICIVFLSSFFMASPQQTAAQTTDENACLAIRIDYGEPIPTDFYDNLAECQASFGYCCINGLETAGLTPSECNAIPGATSGKCQNVDDCTVGETQCVSNRIYECLNASTGAFWSNSGEYCGYTCSSQSDCTEAGTYCNLDTNSCEPGYQVIGASCDEGTSYSSNGGAGAICCVGGANECASNACSISGTTYGKFSTCLAPGGNTGGPSDAECAAQGKVRCGDCGGFCHDLSSGLTCIQEATRRAQSPTESCPGGVHTGGSCAQGPNSYIDGVCVQYCTNVVGIDGDQCGNVDRYCTYIGPENPNYEAFCPTGNGYGDYGWDQNTGCFDRAQIPSEAIVRSHYCACPNGDCTGVSLGQGCQEGSPNYTRTVNNEACWLDESCGILQVDIDYPGNPDGPEHTSRDVFRDTGCNTVQSSVQPSASLQPSASPTASPPAYFCNSNCQSDAQCQTSDSRFECNTAEGNKCRLTTNPTAANCQPAVGPMCLSISLNNISNPAAATTTDPELGDAISLTCGAVQEADHYVFRVTEPDGTHVTLSATGRTSEQFIIDQSGPYVAQCQICTGADDSTCHPFEDPYATP